MSEFMELSGDVLLNEKQIEKRVFELAASINRDFAGKEPVIIAVLNGAYIFAADISRRLDFKYHLDFVNIKTTSADRTGTVKHSDFLMDTDLEGKDVIVLDDIFDSGETANFLKKTISAKNPESIFFCIFIKKVHNRSIHNVDLHYVGFELPDRWLVGYGMDYDGNYRGLPYISYVE